MRNVVYCPRGSFSFSRLPSRRRASSELNSLCLGTAFRMVNRKITRLLFPLLILAPISLAPSPAQAQRSELEKVIQRRVLSNGLEVIVVENHGVPLATVEVDVKNGSFTQSPEYEGLAHMYEHMFFRADAK